MTRHLVGRMILALLLASAARAQVAPTPSNGIPTGDYSAGFEKFYQMGLPNVRGAKYVRLNVFSGALAQGASRVYELDLGGNAWLLGEENGRGRFVMNPGRACDVLEYKLLRGRKAGGAGPAAGVWQDADLARDVAKTVSFLEQKIEDRKENDWAFRQNGYGYLLLLAIHYHAQGYTREAHRICDLLFEHAGDFRMVLVQALNVLADLQYEESCDRFAESGDWAAYRADLEALLARYPAGWQTRPAVSRVAEKVQARIEKPAPPPLAGEDLTDEDRRLAEELAEAALVPMVFRDLLVLPDSAPGGKEENAAHPLARIRARGLAAVPLLLALLKDDYLTRMDTWSLGDGNSRMYIEFSSGGLPDELADRLYESLRRPLARGELAARLLQPLLPTAASAEYGSTDREALYEDAKAWYAEHRNQSPVELARYYLAEGQDAQQRAAIQYLLAHGAEEDAQALEKRLLEQAGDNWMRDMNLVTLYVTRRGPAARGFVDQYEAALRAGTGEETTLTGQPAMDEQVDRLLKNLRQLASGETLEEFVRKIASGNEPYEAWLSLLWQRVSQEKPNVALAALLKAVPQASDARTAGELLGLARILRGGFGRREGDEAGEPLRMADHADLWRAVLADRRSIEDPGELSGATLGDQAAYAVEMLYGEQPATPREGTSYYNLGNRISDLMQRRAEARLEGKTGAELPELPSADRVTAERRSELSAIFGMGGPQDVPRKLSGLNNDELLALAELAEKDSDLNAKLRPASLLIRDARFLGLADEETASWKAAIGKPLDADLARRALEETRSAVAAGLPHTVSFTRRPILDGVVIVIEHGDAARSGMRMRADVTSAVMGALHLDDGGAGARWPVGGSDAEADEGGESDDQDFWAALEHMLHDGEHVCAAGQLIFTGLPAERSDPDGASGTDEE
ncbi:MAG TPA: hypothetical protein P5567_10585 [Kiritimatiellia bacterium]|nr:hypothetical protein [Kiritimatiellia bacterium]HRZ12886.1 hypothetical protein [Kiritimatiellia bacterium]HSA18504.1 hypothetical protein [Kiritimatiellia bacterium]